MRSLRKILTGILITVFAVCVQAGQGLQYVKAYNELLAAIQERGGLTGTSPKPYTKTSTVTQGDLNTLRSAVTDLAKNYFIEVVGADSTFSSSDTKTAAEAEAEAYAIFKPLYYKDDKGTTDTSDDEWKFKALDRDFIKVPKKYTKLDKNIISNSFTDVPILWVHFTDMVAVLNAMKKKKVTVSNTLYSTKDSIYSPDGSVFHVENYNPPLAYNNASSAIKYWQDIVHYKTYYNNNIEELFTMGDGCKTYSFYIQAGILPSYPNVKSFERFLLDMTDREMGIRLWGEENETTLDLTIFKWDVKALESNSKFEFYDDKASIYLPQVPPDPPSIQYAENMSGSYYLKGIHDIVDIATYEFAPVKLSNPAAIMDSSGNDVVLAGCRTCKLGESFVKQFTDAGMSAEFPLGMSSGFDSGLIVFSYLSNYNLGGFKYSHHSLNTSIVGDYSGVEPDGNKWQFTLVQRPRGAQVLMGWIDWSGDTPAMAEAIYGGSYKLKVRENERIIDGFSDNVVHVFPAGAGSLVRCEEIVDDELLQVTPPGSGLSIAGSPFEVTSWGVLKSKPVFDDDDVCTAVYYYVVVAGIDIPFAKYTIEYATQTLAERSATDVYYVADVGTLATSSVLAADPPPAGQEVEVAIYRYYKYIDGAYVLQSETRNSTDGNGNPTSEEFNVDNGSTTSIAQKTTFATLESTDPSITISQKTVTEGTNTFVTITKTKAFPWGNETIEEIEGFGTADEKTTGYEYYDDDTADGYGKLKSVSYPDGTWVRYEYDNLGRTTKEITPVGNVGISATEAQSRVTEYGYTAYVTGDTVEAGDTRPRMTVVKEQGVEVSRSYQGFLTNEYVSIRCQTAGAAWDATDNLVTHKYSYPDGHAFAGRHWKLVNPDGTMSITSYSKTATEFTTTVNSGTGSGDTVTDGIRSISVMNINGWTTSTQTVDIASGLTLSSATYTHDTTGRVTRTDYADGTYTTTAYACCGPSQEVNREGTATTIMYDTLKRVINRETDGVAMLYTYDANDRVLTSTIKGKQGAEQTTTNTYNDAGDLVSTSTPANETTTYSKAWVGEDDGNGGTVPGSERLYETTTYPNGKTQITKFNLDGTVAETYGTAVRHVKYEYGIENGERYTKAINVGENGSETNWTKSYTNFAGQNYKTVNSAGATTLIEYDNVGRPVKQTAPNGVVTLTEYNAKGEVAASAVDMNRDGVIDYGGTDRVQSSANVYESKNGTVVSKNTSSVYATDGAATPTVASVSESAVDGSASWQTSFGNVTISNTVLNGSGQKTITVTNPDNSTVTIVYQNGRMTSSTHSVLGATTYTYDEFNRVSTVTHPENGVDKVTTYAYNAAGQVESITVTSGSNSRTTSYTYNNMGARTSVTLPGGRVVNYTYTDTGELATVTGSDTYPQAYTYDELGRMKTLTTYKSYPGTSEVTTWNYDPASGFLTSKVYADGKGTSYTYNAGGQLLTRQWARGITTTYGYDNAGQQNSIDYSDTTPDISMTYDRMGRAKTVTDASGTRTNTYDTNLRLASSTVPHILNNKLEYTYDSFGRMASMKLMQDTTQKLINSYTYDAMSRIATVSDGTNTAEYTRLPGTSLLNNVTVKQGANTIVSTAKTYDAFNRLLSTASTAGGVTRTYTYEYNDKDQRTKLTLADGSFWEYTYDDKGQVTSGAKKDSTGKVIPGQSFGYTFDDIGNRLTATEGMPQMLFNYTANNVNQYTQRTVPGIVPVTGSAATDATVSVKDVDSGQVYRADRDGKYFSKAVPVNNTTAAKEANLEIHAVKFDAVQDKDIVKTVSGKYMVHKTPQAYTYDDDGNMLTNGAWTYTWNGENRMIQAEKSDKKLEFVYDYMGRRISKKVYTGSTGNWTLASEKKFVYNGYKQIAEFDSGNVLQKTYTWQPVDFDVPLWVKDGANYYYYVVDGNKNIRSMVDVSGNGVASYDYNPFGKIVASAGTYKDTNKYRFSSEYHDDETWLIYYNYRYYDVALGRWLSRDPIGEKDFNGNLNVLYNFVNNNPINLFDNLGLDFIAIASRTIPFVPAHHYSLQYWRCCKPFKPLNQSKGFFGREIKEKCQECEKLGAVELVPDKGWTAWASKKSWTSNSYYWGKIGVWISVIHYSDSSSRVMPIKDGKPQEIKQLWNKIIANAKQYPWAEQEKFRDFKNWPRSHYMPLQTNSRTFIVSMVKQAGLHWTEMSGSHPGNDNPSQNSASDIMGYPYVFSADHDPWKGRAETPKPTF